MRLSASHTRRQHKNILLETVQNLLGLQWGSLHGARACAGNCDDKCSCASSTALTRCSQARSGAQSWSDRWDGAAHRAAPGFSAQASSAYSWTWELAHPPKSWIAVICLQEQRFAPDLRAQCPPSAVLVCACRCHPATVAAFDGTELSTTRKRGCDHVATDDGKTPLAQATASTCSHFQFSEQTAACRSAKTATSKPGKTLLPRNVVLHQFRSIVLVAPSSQHSPPQSQLSQVAVCALQTSCS